MSLSFCYISFSLIVLVSNNIQLKHHDTIPNFLVNVNIHDLSRSMAFTLFAIILAIVWYAWMLTKKSKKGRSHLPPGPRGLPLIGNLASVDPELHPYFARLALTYGPIFKLQLGFKIGIVVNSPSLAKEILKDHDITFAHRDVLDVTRSMAYARSDIVSTPYGPEWRMLRKVCVVKMLSKSTLDSVYPLRRREVRNTIRYIHSRAGSPINVGEQSFLTMLNVVTNMLWGGTVQGEDRAILGAESREVVADISELLGKPNISDFFPGLARFDLQGMVKKMRHLFLQFDQLFEKVIDKRLKIDGNGGNRARVSSVQCQDFLQFLLNLKDEDDAKTPLKMNHVKALLMDIIVGGAGTSSNAIEFAMVEIMNKPEVMRKGSTRIGESSWKGKYSRRISHKQNVIFICHHQRIIEVAPSTSIISPSLPK